MIKNSRASVSSIQTFDSWMIKLFQKSDEIARVIEDKNMTNAGGKLPLPTKTQERKNLNSVPRRYDKQLFQRDASFCWRYVYDGTQDKEQSEVAQCKKKAGQRYWVVTYADGDIRRWIAKYHTRPSCLLHGADEVRIWGPNDLDDEFVSRNREILEQSRGKGLWIWKHYVQYRTMKEMDDGDILLYIDSDFRCDPSIVQYFCLAQAKDVVGFHHSHLDYSLTRLASRDAMILMGLDSASVASSVQSSGGNILFRKSPTAIDFIREMAAWSQPVDVVGNYGDETSTEYWHEQTRSTACLNSARRSVKSTMRSEFCIRVLSSLSLCTDPTSFSVIARSSGSTGTCGNDSL